MIGILFLAGIIGSTVSPASYDTHALPPSADTAGGGSFAWSTYQGPEGTRRYKLYVPAQMPSGPRRLLVMLHGCTQDPEDFARGTRMNSVAGAKGFIVLYPEQPATANPLKCWKWFDEAHQQRGKGEPAILAGMIRKVIADQKIDPSKVYLAGLSAGGAMVTILGATYPEMFSGLAIHSGIAYGQATDMTQALDAMRAPQNDSADLGRSVIAAMGERRKPIPVLIVQGNKDRSVNSVNAHLLMQQWLAVNGLSRNQERQESVKGVNAYDAFRLVYQGSDGRRMFEGWAIPDLAHAWSGGSAEGTYTDPKGPPVSPEIVRFFLDSERPRR